MPGTRDTAVNKTDKVSAFRKLPSGIRGIISKKTYNVESTMKKKKAGYSVREKLMGR